MDFLNLGVAIGAVNRREGVGVPGIDTQYSADFVNGAYVINDAIETLGNATDYTRAGTAYADAANDNFQSFSANAERITDLGILIEPSRENVIRNNSMVGAGALPDNWAQFVGGTIAFTKIGTGTDHGLPYIDFRLSGTANANNGLILSFESATQIVAASGETWSHTMYLAVIGGSVANFTTIQSRMIENTSGGSTVKTQFGNDIKGLLTSAIQRFVHTATLDGGGTVARIRPRIAMDFNNGAVIDLTLRLYAPQLEKAGSGTSPILTTSAAATRAADALVLKLPDNGETHDLLVTFDDDTTQTVSDVPGGDYAVPTNLDRPRVKTFDWRSV